jgi:hypothetical protein
VGGFVCQSIGGCGIEKFVNADHACAAVRFVPSARTFGVNNANTTKQLGRILKKNFTSVTLWQ